jgi:hypothetical protein
LDCSFLNARFTMTAGHTVVLDSLVLLNCRTVNTFGYFQMQNGSRLVLNNTVDFQGPSSVCLPLQIGTQLGKLFQRPDSFPSATGNRSQQYTAYAPASSSWCLAGAAGQSSSSLPPLPPDLLPLLMANSSSAGICRQEAALLGNFARTEPPLPYQVGGNSSRQQQREPVDILWNRSAWLCLEPLTGLCVGQNATGVRMAGGWETDHCAAGVSREYAQPPAIALCAECTTQTAAWLQEGCVPPHS